MVGTSQSSKGTRDTPSSAEEIREQTSIAMYASL